MSPRAPRLLVLLLVLPGTLACSMRSLDRLTAQQGQPPPDAWGVTDDAAVQPDAGSDPPDGAPERTMSPVDADAAGAPGDVGPERPRTPQVLFVVGNVSLSTADGILQKRLGDRGLDVILVDDGDVATVDTSVTALIVISRTATSRGVGARFRTATQPIILSEPTLYDELGMVDATVGSGGQALAQTSLRIVAPGHPLAAGLTGTPMVTAMPGDFGWGTPTTSAVVVATIVDQPTQAAVFAYDTGARMAALGAPARRVGLFLSSRAASDLTPAGTALFDAAVNWALQGR